MMDRRYRRKRENSGFTLAELLVVVAIIMILAGVSFVAAIRYQGQLRRVEMDQTAKQIFLTAQNRLSLETSRGTMEQLLKLDEAADAEKKLGKKTADGEYCVIYAPGTEDLNEEIRDRLLPFGSIDERVRTDGSYLILYEPETGCIRTVWYSSEYLFSADDIGSQALTDAASDPEKRQRFTGANPACAGQTYPIGYHSGEHVENSGERPKTDLEPITLKLYNDEILYAKVHDPNMQGTTAPDHTLQLVLRGVQSGAVCRMELKKADGANTRTATDLIGRDYYVILDDITAAGMNFDSLNSDPHVIFEDGTKKLIPGEDIDASVEVSIPGQEQPVQMTAAYRENSLFGDKKCSDGKKNGRVTIENARHLENLDYRVSAFDPVHKKEVLGLTPVDGDSFFYAFQQKEISWSTFREAAASLHRIGSFASLLAGVETQISVSYHVMDGWQGQRSVSTPAGSFLPVEPQFPLHYDGNLFVIDRLTVTTESESSENGGLFGMVRYAIEISDLKLLRSAITVTGTASAGALIGAGESGAVIRIKNVMIQYPAVHVSGEKAMTSSAKVDAGGVIGSFAGDTLTIDGVVLEDSLLVQASDAWTAALEDLTESEKKVLGIYSAYGNAGGLIGSVSAGNLHVFSSAASVYVDGGDYAGGLFGSVITNGEVSVDSCYVGAHTIGGKLLITPLPGTEGFSEVSGRYNIVSRGTRAGGLAAVMPAKSRIAHSYVTASVYSAQGVDKAPETSEWGKEPEANDGQKEAAFVALFGDPYGMGTAGIRGTAASEHPYCYSAAIVNGARAIVYPETIKELFSKEKTPENPALSYDPALSERTYPMPLVWDLVKQDPSATEETRKALYRYVKVHIGDWMLSVGEKQETPESNRIQVSSGNRLYVEYGMNVPGVGDQSTYITLSVKGTLSQKSYFYVLNPVWNGTDFSGSRLVKVTEPELSPDRVQSYGWSYMNQLAEKRMEILTGENGTIKLRFYIDNLSVPSGGYQALHSIYNNGNSQELTAGEDVEIGIHDGIGISSEDESITMNSMFQKVEQNEDGTYTAYIANARHLENLNFFGNEGTRSNQICVTRAVQTADILWQDDLEFHQESQSEAYGTEMTKAYGSSQIYIGTWSPVPTGSFIPIDNSSLRCYDGNGYTIAGIRIRERSDQNSRGAALFFGNTDLEIRNLKLKNPDVLASNGNAGILISGDSSQEVQQVKLSRITVYGDQISVGVGGYASSVGGIIGALKAKMLVLDQVELFGSQVLIRKNGGGATGGLIGSLNVTDSMAIRNCAFSGYVTGSSDPYNTGGTGGLIGQLVTSPACTGKTVLSNCYVAGRNLAAQVSNGTDGTEFLKDGVNLVGGKKVGGFIGELTGSLAVSNSFCTAGIYDRANENVQAAGGFIGLINGNRGVSFENCYFAGNINQYGSIGKLNTTVSHGWNRDVGILIGKAGSSEITWTSCSYLELEGFSGKPVIGDRKNIGTGGLAVDPSGQTSLDRLFPSGTADRVNDTVTYDPALANRSYPYRIWTSGADGKKVYHGDWMCVDSASVLCYDSFICGQEV